MKRMGILAGMGPRSTTPFLELILDEARKNGAVYDIDYPHILIYSLPTPFYVDREIDHGAMRASLSAGIDALLAGGIDMLAIPCNSAHLYFDHILAEIQKVRPDVAIPVLHIVNETVKKIPSTVDRVVILATPTTINSQLYHQPLASRGISVIHTAALQEQVNALILMLKKEGFSEQAKNSWRDILAMIQGFMCTMVIIACTDISVCLNDKNNPDNIVFLDSNKILAEASYDKYLQISSKG